MLLVWESGKQVLLEVFMTLSFRKELAKKGLKSAPFDINCFKMRWLLGFRPRPRWGSLSFTTLPQTP